MEDTEIWSGALEKRYPSEDARANEAKRDAEGLILNLKSSAKAEGGFESRMSSGRYCGRGEGGKEKRRCMGGPVWGRRTTAMAVNDVRRDRNASAFASIVPPGVGNTVYRGLARRGMWGGTERGA